VLQKYAHVFHDEETNDFNSSDVIEYQVLLDTKPIRLREYKTPFAPKDEMKAQVVNILAKGVIRDSSSPGPPALHYFLKTVLKGSQNSGFALIFPRSTLLPNLIRISCQDLNKLCLFYSYLSISQSQIAIAGSGSCPLTLWHTQPSVRRQGSPGPLIHSRLRRSEPSMSFAFNSSLLSVYGKTCLIPFES